MQVMASSRYAFFCYGIYALFPHDLPQTHSASKGLRSKPLAGTRHALSIEMSYHQHIVTCFCSVIEIFVIYLYFNKILVIDSIHWYFALDFPVFLCLFKHWFPTNRTRIAKVWSWADRPMTKSLAGPSYA